MRTETSSNRAIGILIASSAALAKAGAASAAVSIVMVPVANPGNAADTTGFGSVGYAYNIGATDVTAGQYTTFLNAVATTDPYGLYNIYMATGSFGARGISRSGISGNFT